MIKNVYVAKKFDAEMENLKKRWKNAKLGATQERLEDEMNELQYKWGRYCFKQCMKIGEWWIAHRNGYIEKKERLLPYWEQYLEGIDEYLLSNKEQEELEEWKEVIYQETKDWNENEEEEIFFDEEDED